MVIDVSTKNDEPEYESFGNAVTAAASDQRTEKAESDTALLSGATIIGAQMTDDALSLELDNGDVLRFCANGGVVEWTITDKGETDHLPQSATPVLQLSFSPDASIHSWERQRIVADRLNKKVKRISAAKAWAFLGVEGCETLMFMRLVMAKEGTNLLFYDRE